MSESALLTSVTLSSQVKNHILNLIAEQKLTPGMPVPSEVQLIQKLGVSRGIVREAYRSLAALGILETRSGKVPRIKKFDDEVLRVVFGFALATEQVTTEQILQVRRWLELGVVEAAARNGEEEDFANLRAEMAKIREQFDDVESFITHDIRFHQLLAVASKNPLFMMLLQALHQQLRQSIQEGLNAQSDQKEYGNHIITLHQKICDAVCARDVETATQAMKSHFDSPVSALINNSSP
ncbi:MULTISPECIES: FadR/GntR family transcriptional regulator [Escherichia]|uniref:FadR/GntR family transcriptional regulator n=1 Tax=Escherichia TaxID=561 RepID=UPI0007E45C67|nr:MULTISPECIES: FadR/GntR family transcriptional regulator [Escherichia]MEB7938415.1 FadR family transcriptional regulator [Escherichia whittamii]MEC9495354.1 FadR/GntR family transcriptional regulator [Escherichia whittamii]MEC9558003.1 FadR/GntR family transcriptional regulator [Escherichia whittamii]QLX43824.1 FadR family transcriptional regulator [Escherichia coli]